MIGRATQAESLAALGLYGHLVFFGEASGSPVPVHPDDLYPRGTSGSAVSGWPPIRPSAGTPPAASSQEWVLGGGLRVTVAQSFPLAEAAEAHRRLEQRQTQGKLILLPAA